MKDLLGSGWTRNDMLVKASLSRWNVYEADGSQDRDLGMPLRRLVRGLLRLFKLMIEVGNTKEEL